MNAIEIKNLKKSYGKNVAIDDISLTIKKGEFFGYLGPNGAGKSTTIHAITGIGTYDSGSISVLGHDVKKDYREARKMIGFSAQEFNADFFQRVDKILWYMAGYFGIPRKERAKRVKEALKIFELEEHATKLFFELSGGLKRRVMLARAMIHNPEILILDEPTAGVDVELRREMWKYLKRVNEEGKTILLTSHYLEEVEYLCNRIAFIQDGKIVRVEDKDKLIEKGQKLEDIYLEITKKKS